MSSPDQREGVRRCIDRGDAPEPPRAHVAAGVAGSHTPSLLPQGLRDHRTSTRRHRLVSGAGPGRGAKTGTRGEGACGHGALGGTDDACVGGSAVLVSTLCIYCRMRVIYLPWEVQTLSSKWRTCRSCLPRREVRSRRQPETTETISRTRARPD